MNFLVSYCRPNGTTIKSKTYTYCEAEAIAKIAKAEGCKDISITPLNDFALEEMASYYGV